MLKPWQLVAYTATIVVSLCCLTLVLLYGISFGPIKNMIWLLAFIIAALKRHLIIDVLWTVIYSTQEALITKKPPKDVVFKRQEQQDVQSELDILKRRADILMKKFWNEYYLDENEDPAVRVETEKTNIFYQAILHDLFMFSFYMVALLLIVLGSKDPLAYYSTTNLKQFLMSGTFGVGVETIQEDTHIYEFINATLLENTHRATDMNGELIENEYGWVTGKIGKILGVIQLRQHRIPPNYSSCSILKRDCVGIFNPYYRDTSDYSQNWMLKVNFTYRQQFWRIMEPWMYKGTIESRTTPKFGDITLYPGGGYIAHLGRNYNNSQKVLHYLIENNWLNRRTAVVFIEFTIYNVDANLFNIVTIVGEKTPQGIYKILCNVQTLKLLLVIENLTLATKIVFLLFIILTTIFIYKILIDISNNQFKLFISKPWNIVDLFIVTISVTVLILFLIRNNYIIQLLDELEKSKKNEFVSFQFAAMFDNFLTWVSAILVVVATLRIWKILNFAKVFRILTKTLFNAVGSLTVTVFFAMILLAGFAACNTIINGGNTVIFRNFFDSLISLLILSFGYDVGLSENDYYFGGKLLGILLFLLEMMMMCYIAMNIFATILCFYFSTVKEEAEIDEQTRYTFWQFVKDELHTKFNTIKIFYSTHRNGSGSLRLRGGGSDDGKSKPSTTTASTTKAPKVEARNRREYTAAKAKLVNEIINAQFDYLDKYIQDELRLPAGGAENSSSSSIKSTHTTEPRLEDGASSKNEKIESDKIKGRTLKRSSSNILVRSA